MVGYTSIRSAHVVAVRVIPKHINVVLRKKKKGCTVGGLLVLVEEKPLGTKEKPLR
jgi:hypothetical protein